MKIAILLPSLKNKAPIQVAKDISDQYLNNNWEVEVFYLKPCDEVLFNCPTSQIGLFEEFNYDNYDIIHSHMLKPDLYIWLHRKKIGSICVSTLHNEIDNGLKDLYGIYVSKILTKLWVRFLKSFEEVICLSNYAKVQLEDKFGLKNVNYIHNGRTVVFGEIQKSDLDLINEKKKKHKILGVIANISKIKGIEQIIDCLVELEDYCLIVVGDGPERNYLINKAASLKLDDRCLFMGYRQEAHCYLKYIDIYIMSSYSEGFPLVLIEAAQYKTPIVCSNLPMFKEFFQDHEVSFFELENTQSLISAINFAFNNSSLLSNNIFETFLKNYSVEIMGKNYINNFISLIKNKTIKSYN